MHYPDVPRRPRRRPLRPAAAAAALAVALLALAPTLAPAADWPQYRGPNFNGSSAETGLVANWPKGGPKVLWKVPAGEGFGSFAVAQGKVFLLMERDQNEVCVALDPDSGKELWSALIGPTIFENQGGNGPRSTPTLVGDRVYVLGTFLKLMCLDAADGKVLWEQDLNKDFDAKANTHFTIEKWGNAASPVVDGNLVFVAGGGPGQALLAFDRLSGKPAWKGEDDKITHATPVPATIHGIRQIIFFTQNGLVSTRTDTGEVLWRYPFPFNISTASTPVVGGDMGNGNSGDTVFCSAGYGVGAGCVKVTKEGDKFAAKELWRKQGELMIHWSTPVLHDGHLYGIFGFRELGTAPLKCVELATGDEKWSRPGFGSGGATVLAEGHVLVQSDSGALALVQATPEAYKEVAKIQPLAGKCWTMPVISNGRVYARSSKEVVCLDLSGK